MDAHTELLGVVGHPVRHSISPVFWNAALRHEGRNTVYLAFDVAPSGVSVFLDGMRAAGARGFNVTVPHKTAAYELCTERSDAAEATKAVNVVVFEGDVTSGENTDVHGVREALNDMGVELESSRALVLGAGGAGRAAVRALTDGGAEVSVANRTRERASALGVATIEWTEVEEAIAEFDLVVHATSVGLDGDASVLGEAALRAAAAGRLGTVLDVVYRPQETPLVRSARRAGLKVADGLGMLVHQAGAAWEIFFGSPPPLDVMHRAAASAAGRP